MRNDENYKADLHTWLHSKQYHFFFTGTFRFDPTEHSARRALTRFFGNRETKPEFGFCVIESGKMYGRIHTHGLLRYPEEGVFHSAIVLKQRWENRYGWAKFEEPREQSQVVGYVQKYCTKDLIGDSWIIL